MRPAPVVWGFALAVAASLLVAPAASPQSILDQLEELYAAIEGDPTADLSLNKNFVEATVFIPVHGAKGRKQVRRALWLLLLGEDRLRVYEQEGFPRHRYRENYAGHTRELWNYPDSRTTYIFNESGNLIDTRIYSIDLYQPPIVETHRPRLVFP